MRNLIRTYSITGDHEITITGVTFAENDVRLIVNETQNKVLVSSMQKANVVSVSGGVITLASTTASLVSTDVLTIEIDQAFSVDTSTIAKQGTDSTATLTAVQTATDKIGTAASGQASTLFGAIAAISVDDTGRQLIVQRMRAAGVDIATTATLTDVYNKLSEYFPLVASGCEFASGYTNYNFGDALLGNSVTVIYAANATVIQQYRFYGNTTITSITAPNVTTINGYAFQECTSLTYASFPSATIVGGSLVFGDCVSLSTLNLPNALTLGERSILRCSSLKELYCPLLTTITAHFGNGCTKLNKVTMGANFTSSVSVSYWSPTEALLTTSSSLVEEGESFSNNREKLLYNLRTYIAANLPDRTGLTAYSITWSSAMKTAINADTDTLTAFTSKNWTIA